MTSANANRARGKRTERAIAKKLSGIRRGIMGGHDVEAGPFAVEVKDRARFIGSSFMAQAIKNCPSGKTPLVIVHETGQRHGGDLVMMRLADWNQWYGEIKEEVII
jgi:hypothetical protein